MIDENEQPETETPRLSFGARSPQQELEVEVAETIGELQNQEGEAPDLSSGSPEDEGTPAEQAAEVDQMDVVETESEQAAHTPVTETEDAPEVSEAPKADETESPETVDNLNQEDDTRSDGTVDLTNQVEDESEQPVEDAPLSDEDLGLPTPEEQEALAEARQEDTESVDGEQVQDVLDESQQASDEVVEVVDETSDETQEEASEEANPEIVVEPAVDENGQSVEELAAQRQALDSQIQTKQSEIKKSVLEQIKTVVDSYQITTEELVEFLGGLKLKRKGVKAKAKFKDPKTGITWSGRGKTPNWMKGQDPEKFRIVDTGAEGV